MDLELKRQAPVGDAIAGELAIDGELECLTLERVGVVVPPGCYGLVLYMSPKFGRRVPLLLDVPGRSYVEIHTGNTPKDTAGCIIVGTFPQAGGVGGSGWALTAVVKKLGAALARGERAWLTIKAPRGAQRLA